MAPIFAAAGEAATTAPKTTSAGKPLLLPPDAGHTYDIGAGGLGRIIVGGEQSGGAWWLGSFQSSPGRRTAVHVHHHAEEHFYILEGVVSVWLDGGWIDLRSGALASIPRGTAHALGNRSSEVIRFLGAGNPAGFEGFFADIEALVHRLPMEIPSS